ncbi:MAG: hypothetical protein WA775_10410 [Psychroserpens sp.]|uniref:hypothetical protein n=1 Tax=Psychroserpens sp. TaxID=2020870 RepID=UPI003CBB0D53
MIIEKYTLHKKLLKDGQITFHLVSNDNQSCLAIDSKTRLIYIVKSEEDWLYVGEAKSSLKKRLQSGFNSYRYYKRTNKKRGGYGGYKWIELFDENIDKRRVESLKIIAILFDESYAEKREKIEAVEGELVYLIRQETGKWPLFQNEIHFKNKNKQSFKIALNIMEKI